jgi:hypothetical protein
VRVGERGERLQEQRRLADPRIAADQHNLPRHQAAAQHPVELREARGDALGLARLDAGERHRRRGGSGGARAAPLGGLLGHRAGLAARGAKAHPLHRGRAALRADVDRLRARHQSSSRTGTRGASAHSSS